MQHRQFFESSEIGIRANNPLLGEDQINRIAAGDEFPLSDAVDMLRSVLGDNSAADDADRPEGGQSCRTPSNDSFSVLQPE